MYYFLQGEVIGTVVNTVLDAVADKIPELFPKVEPNTAHAYEIAALTHEEAWNEAKDEPQVFY